MIIQSLFNPFMPSQEKMSPIKSALIVFVLMVTVTLCSADRNCVTKGEWTDFKTRFGKRHSDNEEHRRCNIFAAKLNKIEEHNRQNHTWTMGVNQFTDWTDEEIAKLLGARAPAVPNNVTSSSTRTKRASYPASLDLTTSGGINAIKDQGGCGSCWSFSTNCPLEYAIWKKTGKLPNLAEQNLVDCVYGTSGGCQGGWMATAYDYIKRAGGIASTSTYPYTAKNGACKAGVAKVATITGYVQVATDDASIKAALYNHGPLTVCVDASANFQSYKSGIFQDTTFQTSKPQLNHAVTLVGYGTANGVDYWKIRNSWNTWWGEQGYIRMAAGYFPSGNSKSGLFTNTAIYPTV